MDSKEFYYENGKLKEKGHYENGLKEGPWIEYYESEYTEEYESFKGNYISGKKVGIWEWCWGGGELEMSGLYINDKREGIWRRYHPNQKDPLSGDVFIFFNKRRCQVKLLLWERDGFSIYYKRLERGTYELPSIDGQSMSLQLRSDELMLILQGISLGSVRRRKRFHFSENKSLNNQPVPV